MALFEIGPIAGNFQCVLWLWTVPVIITAKKSEVDDKDLTITDLFINMTQQSKHVFVNLFQNG